MRVGLVGTLVDIGRKIDPIVFEQRGFQERGNPLGCQLGIEQVKLSHCLFSSILLDKGLLSDL